jgi:hypothetical protein
MLLTLYSWVPALALLHLFYTETMSKDAGPYSLVHHGSSLTHFLF